MGAVIYEAMKEIDVSKAIRRCELDRVNALARHGKSKEQPRRVPRTKDEQREIGQRAIARELVLKCKRFERQYLDADGNWVKNPAEAPRNARARIRKDPTYVSPYAEPTIHADAAT